ncbi:MAG: methionine adenosyltransferase [Ruminococcaceae bacterium]|jgi:S-adenosylmethionine synthetase|nr:methionine adenosyltransferase [Oscillospiraceae bacterium]
MMIKNGPWLFTSESVTEGHPDKVCDQVSDAILDEILQADELARVACEAIATTGMMLIMGEISTSANIDIPALARKTIREIGYTDDDGGFSADTCAILTTIDKQSPDIAQGVDHSLENRSGSDKDDLATGAGDQGMMFGFANSDTPELMPLPISLAHALTRRLAEVRKAGLLPYLKPDGKAQVTVAYQDDKPVHIDTVVVSTQHQEGIESAELHQGVLETIIRPVLPAELFNEHTRVLVNPTGKFVRGGPQADSGLTGRKIIVDTYGGFARHGGGSFSGKDPTKVDRSATYAARYVAKNIVAAGLASCCEVQLAYAIGVARPISITLDTYGTEQIPVTRIHELVKRHFDLRPAAIIRDLGLRRPIYRQIAAYGHFGRPDLDLPWERTDRAALLRSDAGLS